MQISIYMIDVGLTRCARSPIRVYNYLYDVKQTLLLPK